MRILCLHTGIEMANLKPSPFDKVPMIDSAVMLGGNTEIMGDPPPLIHEKTKLESSS
jgi:hypothetical protein